MLTSLLLLHGVSCCPQVSPCINHPSVGFTNSRKLEHVEQLLVAAWDVKARKLSREMAAARNAGGRTAGSTQAPPQADAQGEAVGL